MCRLAECERSQCGGLIWRRAAEIRYRHGLHTESRHVSQHVCFCELEKWGRGSSGRNARCCPLNMLNERTELRGSKGTLRALGEFVPRGFVNVRYSVVVLLRDCDKWLSTDPWHTRVESFFFPKMMSPSASTTEIKVAFQPIAIKLGRGETAGCLLPTQLSMLELQTNKRIS